MQLSVLGFAPLKLFFAAQAATEEQEFSNVIDGHKQL
jgi:hypothetical protein